MRKTVEEMCIKYNEEYERRTKPRKMVPIFSRSCHCCGDEIKFESIWEIAVPLTVPFSDRSSYYYGCTKCFPESEDFYNQLVNEGYINQSAWVFREKPENVSLEDWAVMSGYYKEEELENIAYKNLLRTWVSI